MAVIPDYEVSFEGAERKWPVPYARLADTTPEAGEPCQLLSAVTGVKIGGTVLVTDAADSVAVVDFTPGKIVKASVRNVITYTGGDTEATFRAINIGDPVYYDASATMPAGVKLSTSPLDAAGAANAVWGYVMPMDEGATTGGGGDMALYPKGGNTASTQTVGVMQRGAGA